MKQQSILSFTAPSARSNAKRSESPSGFRDDSPELVSDSGVPVSRRPVPFLKPIDSGPQTNSVSGSENPTNGVRLSAQLLRNGTRGNFYKCPYCASFFGAPEKFQQHFQQHVFDQPYSCSCCNMRADTAQKVAKHVRVMSGADVNHRGARSEYGQPYTVTLANYLHPLEFHSQAPEDPSAVSSSRLESALTAKAPKFASSAKQTKPSVSLFC